MVDDVRNETSWHNPDAYIRGLEDTRVVRQPDGGLYTLSASMEYARGPGTICQVLRRLDVDKGVHTMLAVLKSPCGSPCEKNWVVAGSLEKVMYRWYPDV